MSATRAACARSESSPTPVPGLAETAPGRDAEGIRAGLEDDELSALLLFGADPVRDYPGSDGWRKALQGADFVLAFAMFEDASAASSPTSCCRCRAMPRRRER